MLLPQNPRVHVIATAPLENIPANWMQFIPVEPKIANLWVTAFIG
jgi:hypothetical protein